ncbi:MAG: thioredoxin domain-containing protein, partial [Pirellulales bacterium]
MRVARINCIAAILAILLAPRGDLLRGDEPAREPEAKAAPEHTNRLAKETSPYLLLHAHNPVDWYPWGEEALSKARKEKKLIFLSVGYSSCYWCHVMERQSFTDEEIAAKLNENFVCIKVDREERPDVDEIYMQALHIYLQLVGSKQGGGWPLSMFLTPDAKPLMG